MSAGGARSVIETIDETNAAGIIIINAVKSRLKDGPKSGGTCRYCLEGEPLVDLIAPCMCKGHSQWVHKACLRQWQQAILTLIPDRTDPPRCEICRTVFNLSDRVAPGSLHNNNNNTNNNALRSPVAFAPGALPPNPLVRRWYGNARGGICRYSYILVMTYVIFIMISIIIRKTINPHQLTRLTISTGPASTGDSACLNISGHLLLISSIACLPGSIIKVASVRACGLDRSHDMGRRPPPSSCVLLLGAAYDVLHTPIVTLLIPLVACGYILLYIDMCLLIPIVISLILYDIYYIVHTALRYTPYTHAHPREITGTPYVIQDNNGGGDDTSTIV